MSSCDCDRKTSNGGNCDSSCRECEPAFVFETGSARIEMTYTPVLMTAKVAEVGGAVSHNTNILQ